MLIYSSWIFTTGSVYHWWTSYDKVWNNILSYDEVNTIHSFFQATSQMGGGETDAKKIFETNN